MWECDIVATSHEIFTRCSVIWCTVIWEYVWVLNDLNQLFSLRGWKRTKIFPCKVWYQIMSFKFFCSCETPYRQVSNPPPFHLEESTDVLETTLSMSHKILPIKRCDWICECTMRIHINIIPKKIFAIFSWGWVVWSLVYTTFNGGINSCLLKTYVVTIYTQYVWCKFLSFTNGQFKTFGDGQQ